MYLVYFSILFAAWACAWFCGLSVVLRPTVSSSAALVGLALPAADAGGMIGVFAAYVVSYPVASVVVRDSPQLRPLMDLYVPATWVVGNTPARGPILRIAGYLGERDAMERSSDFRIERGAWGEAPILSGLSAALLVSVLAIVPPLLLAKARKRRNRDSQKDSARSV